MKMLIGLALVTFLAGCGGSPAGREPDEYTGCGTDENWRTFDDQEPSATVDDTQAPLVTRPTADATVAADQLIVTWQQDANDVGAVDGDVPHDGPGCKDCCPNFNAGALPKDFLTNGKVTPAHLPPISGNAYDLQFSIEGKVVWRVVTTLQAWALPPAQQAAWKGKKVSLQIWRLDLLRNDVKEGPFVATKPFTFTISG